MTCDVCVGRGHHDPHKIKRNRRGDCYDCGQCSCENNRKSICLLGAGLVATLGVAITALLRSEKNSRDIADLAKELADFEDRIQKEIEDLTPPVGTVLEIKPTTEPIGGIYYPYNGTQSCTFWYQLCAGFVPPSPTPCPKVKPFINCRKCMKQLFADLSHSGDSHSHHDLCQCDVPEHDCEPYADDSSPKSTSPSDQQPGCYEPCDMTALWQALGEPELVQGSDGNFYFQITEEDCQLLTAGLEEDPTTLVIVGPCSAEYVFCRTYDPITGCNEFIPQLRPQAATICDQYDQCT